MPNDSVPFWQKPVPDLFKEFSTHSDGLTTEQSDIFYKRYGPNSLETTHRRNAFISFILLFKNPLVLLLPISAILAMMIV